MKLLFAGLTAALVAAVFTCVLVLLDQAAASDAIPVALARSLWLLP